MPKMLHFGEFLKTLLSNSVTRQAIFNKTKIVEKYDLFEKFSNIVQLLNFPFLTFFLNGMNLIWQSEKQS